MKRITIIIDEDTWDRLPIKGKSPYINLVLKNHFRNENAEQFYKYIKQRLIKDFQLTEGNCPHGRPRGRCIHIDAVSLGCND